MPLRQRFSQTLVTIAFEKSSRQRPSVFPFKDSLHKAFTIDVSAARAYSSDLIIGRESLNYISHRFTMLESSRQPEYIDHEVPDDKSVVAPILAELKRNFLLQTTKDIKFRKQQLQNLIRGHFELKATLDEALRRDLGYNTFTAQFNSHGFTEIEMRSSLDNIDKWTKPESVDLPIGKCWLTQLLVLGRHMSGLSHLELHWLYLLGTIQSIRRCPSSRLPLQQAIASSSNQVKFRRTPQMFSSRCSTPIWTHDSTDALKERSKLPRLCLPPRLISSSSLAQRGQGIALLLRQQRTLSLAFCSLEESVRSLSINQRI